jgi:citrate lyase beta subunit
MRDVEDAVPYENQKGAAMRDVEDAVPYEKFKRDDLYQVYYE